jgi:hypothetical protein
MRRTFTSVCARAHRTSGWWTSHNLPTAIYIYLLLTMPRYKPLLPEHTEIHRTKYKSWTPWAVKTIRQIYNILSIIKIMYFMSAMSIESHNVLQISLMCMCPKLSSPVIFFMMTRWKLNITSRAEVLKDRMRTTLGRNSYFTLVPFFQK